MESYTLLYVDDEPDLLHLGKTFLESIGNFSIDTKESAQDGLESLSLRPYDAVISDYQMPGMDGLVFLKEVRAQFGNLPFILFTGRGREDVVIEAINSGADFYLQKGGDIKAQFAELAHKINMAVERKRAMDARHDSEKRLSSIFHASPIHQMITEFSTGRILDINDRFLEDLGLARADVIGKTTEEIGLYPDPDRQAAIYGRLIAEGTVRNAELTIRAKSDRTYTTLVSLTRVKVPGQDLVYTQSMDITAQKKVQQTINALINAPPDVSMLLDREGTILAVNQAASRRFHLPEAELVGKNAYNLLSPGLAALRKEKVEASATTKKPLVYTDDRTGMTYENHIYPVIGADGGVATLAIYSRDITEEKQAKEALRKSEEKYRLIVENSHDTIYIYRDRRLLFVNRQAEELTGYTHAELMEKDLWELIHPDDHARLQASAKRRFGGEDVSPSFNARIVRKNGEIRDAEFFVDLVDFQGQPAIFGIARDVTDKRRAEENLQEREEQLRSLADNLPSGMVYQVVIGPDGKRHFAHVSAGVRQIHEVSPEDVLRDPAVLYNQIVPEDRTLLREAEDRALATMSSFGFETRIRTPSGKERWIHLRSAPRALGTSTIWDGIELDITASKRAEEELKAAYEQLAASQEALRAQLAQLRESREQIVESEEKYRTLVSHTADGVFIAQDGKLIFVNSSLTAMSGYSAEELTGRPFDRLVAPEDREMVIARHKNRLTGDVLPETYEFSLLHRDGTTRVRVKIQVGAGTYRKRPAAIGTIRDITEERRHEAAIIESEELYRKIVSTIPDIIVRADLQGNITFVNDNGVRLSGWDSPSELVGKSMFSFMAPESIQDAVENTRLMFERPLGPKEYTIIKKDGGRIILEVNGDVLRTPDRTPYGLVYICRNITERQQAEQALRESEERYRTILDNLQDAYIRADTGGRIIMASPSAAGMFGYGSAEEMLGIAVVTLYATPQTREDLLGALKKKGRVKNYFGDGRRKDGSIIGVSISLQYYYDERGNVLGTEGIVRDVSDQKAIWEALCESEARFRGLTEKSQDIIMLFDRDLRHIYVNPMAERISGIPPAQLTGKTPRDLGLPPALANLWERALQEAFATGNEGRVEFRVPASGLWIDWLLVPVRGPDGSITEVITSARDITDRKRAEEALRQSEELHRDLFNASPDGIAMVNMRGILTYVSPKALEMFGLTRQEEAVGTSVLDWIIEEDRKLAGQRFADVIAEKSLISHVYRVHRKDGSRFVVEMHSSALHDSNGSVTGVLSILHDITSRRRAEEELQKSEENYRLIIENMQDVFYRVDNKGIITMISPYGARIVGYDSPADITGKLRASEFYANPAERDAFMAHLMENKVVTGYPLSLKDRYGNLHYATASCRLLYDADGAVDGIEGILHDVTHLKEVENALRQANRQITLMTSITRHDIRNQLLALGGWLELSRASVADPDLMLELIAKEQKIADVISQQISFTTLIDDMGLKAPIWQDPVPLIEKARLALPFRDVRLDVDIPAVEIYSDLLFEKVFYNLLDNALRYGSESMTMIRVTAKPDKGRLLMVIEDNGGGIRAQNKGRIFERGFGENTGLGLFLVKEILAITGITIRENSEPGTGARFEIRVPGTSFRYKNTPPRQDPGPGIP